jgi:hypothetical protein
MFGCLGLHEWAMVYEEKDVRHPGLPLRLTQDEVRGVVETLPLCCTHYDAFRFFSRRAQPMNARHLTAENRVAMEQPGCLHANMDLFKWCLKLFPLVPSDLWREAFDLALRARWIDMRASPYDVRVYGQDPIAIETPEGRREYVRMQRSVALDARPVRYRLIALLERAAEESGIRL